MGINQDGWDPRSVTSIWFEQPHPGASAAVSPIAMGLERADSPSDNQARGRYRSAHLARAAEMPMYSGRSPGFSGLLPQPCPRSSIFAL
jgi:hypothetical protein